MRVRGGGARRRIRWPHVARYEEIMTTRKAQLRRLVNGAGIDPGRFKRTVRGTRPYLDNRKRFLEQAAASGGEFAIADDYPCLTDRFDESGVANGQYFHQDLYVAQRIHAAQPRRHLDVGSRVDGFVAHVAAFRPIDVMDIRPLSTTARNITFLQRDITRPDPSATASTDSLSCLHALEHVGLGRYGDDLDYYGYRKGWDNLVDLLQPGGRLYFSVPISDRQRIEFDAHRVFSVRYLCDELFAPSGLRVEDFAYVDDAGELHAAVDVASPAAQASFGLTYGCGVFTLIKDA